MAEKNRRQTMAKVGYEKDIGESVEVRIASAIKELPSVFLTVKVYSPKQQEIWQSLREFNRLVSECFLSNSFFRDDPLSKLTKGSTSDKLFYDQIWADVHFFRDLWSLTQQAFVYIKEEAKAIEELLQASPCFESDFSTSLNFFLAVLRLEEDNLFNSYCQQFHEFSVQKASAEAKIRKKGLQTEEDLQKLREIHSSEPNNLLFQWLIACSERHKKENSTLRAVLRKCEQSLADRFTVREQILEANKRGKLDAKLYSFAMLDGQEVKRRAS